MQEMEGMKEPSLMLSTYRIVLIGDGSPLHQA